MWGNTVSQSISFLWQKVSCPNKMKTLLSQKKSHLASIEPQSVVMISSKYNKLIFSHCTVQWPRSTNVYGGLLLLKMKWQKITYLPIWLMAYHPICDTIYSVSWEQIISQLFGLNLSNWTKDYHCKKALMWSKLPIIRICWVLTNLNFATPSYFDLIVKMHVIVSLIWC